MKTTHFFIFCISLSLSMSTHSQVYQWAMDAGGTLDDEIFDMTHDAAGNIYVTGIFEGTADLDPGPSVASFTVNGEGDMFFAKFDADGNYLWAKAVGSIGDEEGQGIELDADGYIYLTGLYSDVADFDPGAGTYDLTSNGGFDIYIAKYDNDGNFMWAGSIGDYGAGDDCPSKMTIDSDANIYVTGQFDGTADFDPGAGTADLVSTGGWDIFFAKYDSSGSYTWAKSIENSTNADDYGYNIAVDATQNVYVTGQYDGTCDFDPGIGTASLTSVGNLDAFFAKYDIDGNYVWANSIGGTADDAGNCIALDGSGNVFVAGYFTGTVDFDAGAGTSNLSSAGAEDIFYMKYDNDGNYTWAKNTGGSDTDVANWLTFDASGNIFLTGQFSLTADFDPDAGTANSSSAGSWDIFFAKYNSDGSYNWSASVGGIGVDQSHVIDYVSAGNFLIAGEFPNSVDFDPNTGTATLSSFGLDDIFFAKYYDGNVGIEKSDAFSKPEFFPNPVSNLLNISVARDADMKLFDAAGQEVGHLNLGSGTSTIDFSYLRQGVYVAVIQCGAERTLDKIIVR